MTPSASWSRDQSGCTRRHLSQAATTLGGHRSRGRSACPRRTDRSCRRAAWHGPNLGVRGRGWIGVGQGFCLLGSIRVTMRSRSSREANSTVILPLVLPRSTLTRVSKRSERRSARSTRRGATGLLRRRGGSRVVGVHVAQGDDLFDRADREPFGDDALGEALDRVTARQAEERARVARGQDAGGDATLDRGRQLQQPERVGDLRTRPADPGGEDLLGAAEVVEHLLVGGRLFERVQLAAVQVLQQRVPEHHVVRGVAHDGGDRGRGRPAGSRASAARPSPARTCPGPAGVRRSAAAGRSPSPSGPAPPSPPRRRRCAAASGSG